MTTGATGQLGLALPVQGELSGTWGDTVNNGLTQYINIAIAGTLTLTNDGAVTLANTTGDASASNVTSTLTGAGTVTAQFAIVRVTGTLTTAKVVTAPSYSKTYTVVNAATGGIVTFKASGQTGVSIAVGESAFVYFNGTDYVKVSGTASVTSFSAGTTGLTPSTSTTGAVTLAGTLAIANGGTGQTTANTALNALLPSQTGNANKYLQTDGTNSSWDAVSLSTADITGTLGTANGGTGLTSFTSGGVVYASSTSALATGSALTFDGTNLGVGETSPSTFGKLVVKGGTINLVTDTSAQRRLSFWSQGNGNSENAYIQVQNDGATTNTGEILFATKNASASLAERARFTASGNLGIGTSSPAYKLDVTGVARVGGLRQSFETGLYNVDGTLSNYSATNGVYLNGNAAGWLRLCGDGTGASYLQINGASASSLPNVIQFNTASSERMRLDSAGNLGLGVTPSAWGSGYKSIDLNTFGGWTSTTSAMDLVANGYFNGTNWIAKTTAASSRYVQTSGAHTWKTAASVTAGNSLSYSDLMTLNASGNLGLGYTPSAWNANFKSLQMQYAAFTADNSNGYAEVLNNAYASGASTYTYINTLGATRYSQQLGAHKWFTASSGTAGTAITFTQAMTLDANQTLLLGATAANLESAYSVALCGSSSAGNAGQHTFNGQNGNTVMRINQAFADTNARGAIYFYRSGTQVGSITVSSTVTAYNTTSDQRLKENIQNADSASSLIDAIQVRKFDWKESNLHERYGFVAQELLTVVPEAVHQPEDTDAMMSVDYSKLVPMLVKEIQSLRVRVAQLETN